MFDTVLLQGTASIPGLSGKTAQDFWSWGYSNLIANTTRCTFGEYLVASALGLDDAPRKEWTPCDLVYRGTTIEVKTSGYMQAWHQKKPSTISFDIAPRTYTWNLENNVITALEEMARVALLYVFCVHTAQVDGAETEKLDPVLLIGAENWEFYAVPTSIVNDLFRNQKRVRLSILRVSLQKHGYMSTPYAQLKSTVDRHVEARTG